MQYTRQTSEHCNLQSRNRLPDPSFASPSIYTGSIHLLFHWTRGKHASLKRFIPVQTLYDQLKPSQLVVMIPMFYIIGCDMVSTFHGHGKGAAFPLMIQQSEHVQPLWSIRVSSWKSADIRWMYAWPSFVVYMVNRVGESLNELRCKMSSSQRKVLVGKKLPPTVCCICCLHTTNTWSRNKQTRLSNSYQMQPVVAMRWMSTTNCSPIWRTNVCVYW
jgi:hypothetical protein